MFHRCWIRIKADEDEDMYMKQDVKTSHAASLIGGKDIMLSREEIERLEFLAKASGVQCKGIWE